MRVRVKICGIRTLEEAQAAIEAGADALGFNFWPKSPRYVAPAAAKQIIESLSPFACSIGVFVNEEASRVCDIASELMLDAVQLHGDESPEYCLSLAPAKIIKAIRIGRDADLSLISDYRVKAVLLDTSVAGAYGGTGKLFDWKVAIEAKRIAPIILAGGLTIDNVKEAITLVRPLAVDVCSGVEAEPGRKDLFKIRMFMNAVEWANAALAPEVG